MRTFEVRNRLTGMVIAEVAVEHPEEVMGKVIEETGSAIEEVAAALGKNMSEVREALDIVEKPAAKPVGKGGKPAPKVVFRELPRPSLFRDLAPGEAA